MSVLTWPDELVNLAAWERLPVDTTHHVECSEGILVVTPKPLLPHQYALFELRDQLMPQLPRELGCIGEVDVLLADDPLTVRSPDVLIAARDAIRSRRARLVAEDVRLAVEILSPGSRRTDRVTKLSEYAEAGIPDYWIVDLDAAVLTSHRLGDDGTYVRTGEHSGVATVEACKVKFTIDVTALV